MVTKEPQHESELEQPQPNFDESPEPPVIPSKEEQPIEEEDI